jgi:glycosyltransferase involved in cell wall biosynthesis
MKAPYFSVVIPTKNRSFLMGQAIRSVLDQSFRDTELIIADNDDTDATHKVVAGVADPRLKYLRTGNLSMPDNWERGCQEARGEFLVVLEDKQVLKQNALARIFEVAEREQPETMKWGCDTFEDVEWPPRLRRKQSSGGWCWRSAEEMLRSFCEDADGHYKHTLPLPQRSAISRRLLEKIKAGTMGRLCHPVTPDVILGLLQLNYADRVLEFHDAFCVLATIRHSNGRSLALKGALGKQFQRELGGKDAIFCDLVPVKAVIIPGIIYNDFLHLQSKVPGRLATHTIRMSKYYVECHRALRQSQELGVDMSREMAAWHEALRREPESVQTEIVQMVAEESGASAPGKAFTKKLGRQLGIPKLGRYIKWLVRGKLMRDPDWCFGNVMEYLHWEAAQNQGIREGDSAVTGTTSH